MKKIIGILFALCIFVVGCSKEDTSSYDKYLEEGKAAITNQDYEKGRNFFSLAKEENTKEEEANVLYNQTNNLVEAIASKEDKHYDVAIQLCDTILNMNSKSDVVKNAAKDLKEECEKLKKESTEKVTSGEEETVKNQDKEDSSTVEDIRSDYRNKAKEVEDLAVKRDGIFRYQASLINILRSYDINDVQRAKVVYELSDELLNNLYQSLKTDLSEDLFNELKEEQVQWVKNKIEKENTLNNDQLLKYQTLAKMTLDRCEEFNNRY